MDDPRVYMAAERTLLAWIRTGLAMMGFGFVVARFGLFLHELAGVRDTAPPSSPHLSLWLGVLLVVGGIVTNLLATRQHLSVLRRLRSHVEYQPSAFPLEAILAVALAVVGLAMAVYLVLLRT